MTDKDKDDDKSLRDDKSASGEDTVHLPEVDYRVDAEKATQHGPHPQFAIPHAVTLQDDETVARELRLRRQNSVGAGPRQVDTTSRLVGEFRTLSIHVTDSLRHPEQTEAKRTAVRELTELDWHKLDASEVCQRLNVSPKAGLDREQVKRRLHAHGYNEMTPPSNNVLLKWFWYVFGGFGTVLFLASVLCFIAWRPLGDPNPAASNLALAVVLLIVIVIQTAFNAYQDWSTGKVMASIMNLLPQQVTVLRDGAQLQVEGREIVTGDLVYIVLGNKLPADVRFLQVSSDFKLDRAVLTGESEPIAGTVNGTDESFLESKNIGLQGTLCVGGSGLGVVIQTGDNTVFGRIAALSAQGGPALTTLQREIAHFVWIIVGCALTIALIIIILWAAWLNPHHKGFMSASTLVINVVSVCVAFIPEGLPISVTVSLSVIARTLAKNKVLCKTLMTVETLGSVSVLCSDKTGTLTQNVMTVTSVAVLDDDMDALAARDRIVAHAPGVDNVRQLAAIAGVCNAAVFDKATEDQPVGLRKVHGDATDSAILRWAEFTRPVAESQAEWAELFKVNFNSKTKFMLKLLRPSSAGKANGNPAPVSPHERFEDGDAMLLCKGAPDVLLKRCSAINNLAGGPALLLTEERRAALVAVQERWASKGQRVLLLAKRVATAAQLAGWDTHGDEFADHVNIALNQELTVVGLLGLVDPPRPDIPDTIRVLRAAGIRVFMVTGDFALTAVSIAEQCGIVTDTRGIHRLADLPRDAAPDTIERYDPDGDKAESALAPEQDGTRRALVLSGPDLMQMTDAQWAQACEYPEIVFARTTPEQKLRIVKEFQGRGAVVGMTGDGVNDAPSLKAADVGIAMGGGSDVAMEAADLVLLESFSSMVVAVTYGRLVFDNLKKTILYLLPAGSFSELTPILVCVFFGLPQMMSSIAMILVCCLTDVLPAVAMCFEKPETGLLLRKPRDTKKDKLVNWKLLFHAYAILGVLESLCAFSMAFWYMQRAGFPFSKIVFAFGGLPPEFEQGAFNEAVARAQSVYFFTLVFMQWGNLLATRTRRLSIFQHNPFWGPARNLFVPCAMAASIAFLFFFSYVPFFQKAFVTRGVAVEYIFIPVAFVAAILLLDEARKYAVRRWPHGLFARIAW